MLCNTPWLWIDKDQNNYVISEMQMSIELDIKN